MSAQKTGFTLLHDPLLNNRGSAFTLAQRQQQGIEGLLPQAADSLETQVARIHLQLDTLDSDLQKYLPLSDLQSRNQTLFAVIMSDPATFMPLVYTPTVGRGLSEIRSFYRAPRGVYLPITAKGRLKELLSHWPQKDIRFIVVTDGGTYPGLRAILALTAWVSRLASCRLHCRGGRTARVDAADHPGCRHQQSAIP